ncbi:LysR family transcriptional regulator, positive regulator for ilvC [Oceanospirillum multiglobuliferum]|uniref:Transcriptional regulator IlvY n=1 Tax=Oceanospirillum multiglobuliferum TaxID=64969 RepID=A0A1T4M0S9_9GAMM|nr:HTH-type transcriptional activator IlvY [Oceanospirillum multiglobuliferum]OPX56291.1 transcriptional regulator IlvY [Oceanospirillum multiglobuliferum]SJZ60495.1 LysR family transcriptional regulator, positive regulator for ilvC [Oceanospirillum multiglobuliferum]
MDTRLLKHFLVLSETLHFGRASELCHISSSALSRSIKQLEDSLGVALFERDNRTVSLTREGVKFQRYARDALSHWDMIRNALLEEAQELQGELSMYCSVTASYSFLHDILRRFRSSYPKIEIKLHTGDPAPAPNRVLNGDEDIAIAARPDSLPSALAFKSIGLSPLLFIAPVDDPVLAPHVDKPIEEINWSEVPMILSEQGLARSRVDRWFSNKALKPNIYAQVAGNEAIVSMVSLGFGVGVVPKIVLENSPLADRVKVLPVTPTLPAYDVGVCVLQKKLKNPLIEAFWAQL